ncbi:hypothetical protein B0E33_22225 [Roseibium algicola]|uniref:Uncharacterized protein n=1 Tax=Roseibium algicola TaxID=2857014 RepID=A0ABN4WZT0_9HYPH|nr:hypothetical protein B0E33_22225 [Roseibium aggregatum]
MRNEAGEGAEIEDDRQMRRQDAPGRLHAGFASSFIEQASGGREEAASDQFKDRVGAKLKASLEEGSKPAGGDWGKSSRQGITKVTAKPGAVGKRARYEDGCA